MTNLKMGCSLTPQSNMHSPPSLFGSKERWLGRNLVDGEDLERWVFAKDEGRLKKEDETLNSHMQSFSHLCLGR